MASVLLVNTNLMKPAIAPIGLDYLAGALKNKSYQVDLLDLCFTEDFRKAIDEYFKNNSPVIVGITIRNTDDCYFQSGDFFSPKIKQITDYLKPKTDSPLVLGGVGFSIMPEQILSYCGVELGICGDGEQTFVSLVGKITSGKDYYDLPGLVCLFRKSILRSNTTKDEPVKVLRKHKNEEYQINPPKFVDLDEIVLPERDFVDNRRYFKEGGQGNIETKRGCNQKCIYCADPIAKGRKIRLRSPKKVVEEMKNLLKQGVDCLHTCDSEFNLPEEHAKAVCEEIIRQKLNTKIRWYTYCSPVPFSEELVRLMKKAGCAGIDFGVDSGSPKILKILKRNFGIEEIKNTAKLCHQYRITFMFDLLLGGPGETRETIKETISLMKEISPDRGMHPAPSGARVHRSGAYRVGVMLGVRVYPGTELAKMVKDEERGMHQNGAYRGLRSDRNDNFFSPTFYLSPQLGEDIDKYISGLIAGDERFFFSSKEGAVDYNYNQNKILMQAIKQGYKGAYWDILRRWQTKRKPSPTI